MIHFTVGPLSRPTSLLGALRHFGVSSTLRRRIKRNGVCTVNGQIASTTQFVYEGDIVCVDLPQVNSFSPEPIPFVYRLRGRLPPRRRQARRPAHAPDGGRAAGHAGKRRGVLLRTSRQHCSYHPDAPPGQEYVGLVHDCQRTAGAVPIR